MGETVNPLHRELSRVKEELAKMGGMVEGAINKACQALNKRDTSAAHEVILGDRPIDLMQNQIEKHCLALLATQQPVAVDLRFLAGAIIICLFLERMGDQAVNLAQRVMVLSRLQFSDCPPTLLTMANIAKDMTKDCLDAIARDNVGLAQHVMQRDDELDDLNHGFLEEMVQWMTGEQRLIRRGIEFILASRHLERIGDLATNVAEQVVYLVEGRIIRHQGGEGQEVAK